MEILEYETRLMDRMIQSDPDVTVKEYWETLQSKPWNPSVKVVSTNRRFSNFPRHRPQPMKDPSPFKRPPAIYDNRSRDELLRKYS